MKIQMGGLKLVLICSLMLPLMGADGGCGEGTDPTQPGVVTPPEPKCSPRTCEGCCSGDVCHALQTNAACGSFGAQCAVCQGLNSCQFEAQSNDWNCRPAKYSIQPMMASIPLLDPNDGADWDADSSAPDVVVELSCPKDGSTVFVSTSEVSSYTPTWTNGACEATAEELMKSPMSINVIDVDAFFDDEIFSGTRLFKAVDFEQPAVEIPISTTDATSVLRLKISRVR